VSETVGGWLNQESNALEQIKILDPAGGSGAFPNQVHNFLAKKQVEQIRNKSESEGFDPNLLDIDEKVIDKSILKNNIFMVDLQPESVEIAKLSLWLKTAKKDQKLNNLDENVKCGNSLKIKWREYFALPGFDVILGNPPYIKEYTNKSAFDGLHDNPYYQGKMDLWTMFACIAIDELKDGGYLAFIAPNNWISNAGASILRDKILTDGELQTFIDFGDFKVFEDAGIQTMVFVFKKGNPRNKYTVNYARVEDKNTSLENIKLFLSSKLTAEIDGITKFQAEIEPAKLKGKNLSFVNKTVDQILEKMEAKREFVLTDKEVGQGIVAAPDKYFLVEKIDNFNFDERNYLKPCFTASGRYETAESTNYIFYISSKNFKSDNLDNYPNIKAHFEPNKEILTEAKIKYETPSKPYFFLHREREERFFEKGEKIVCAIRTEKPSFYYTESEYYGSRALNFIKTDRINLKYLTAILNSNIIYFWLKHKGKLLGDLLQIDKAPLLNIPIPQATPEQQAEIVELVDQIMELKKESQKLTDSFVRLIQAKYLKTPRQSATATPQEGNFKISTKLKNWHKLEIAEFLDELKKQKAVIGGLSAEAELMAYFDEQKTKVLEVEKGVERVDGEVEGLVRGLYGVENIKTKQISFKELASKKSNLSSGLSILEHSIKPFAREQIASMISNQPSLGIEAISSIKSLMDSLPQINSSAFSAIGQLSEIANSQHIKQTSLISESLREMINPIAKIGLQINSSLDIYNNALSQFNQINFEDILNTSKLLQNSLPDYSKIFEQIRQPLFDFTKISNQLNLDYFAFYQTKFDFGIGRFKTNEDAEEAEKYEEKIVEFDETYKEKVEVIERVEPEILVPFKVSWYSLLENIKRGIENRSMKEFWQSIDEKKLKERPEDIGQNIIDSFLHFSESFFNTGSVRFEFSREDIIFARGRVDFIFRFITPFYKRALVEIKVIQKEEDLYSFGNLQLLDYMKKRKFDEGIRVVLNATQNHNVKNFESDGIINYFINIWQPTSSSLNK